MLVEGHHEVFYLFIASGANIERAMFRQLKVPLLTWIDNTKQVIIVIDLPCYGCTIVYA